jgi:hypothetical protein
MLSGMRLKILGVALFLGIASVLVYLLLLPSDSEAPHLNLRQPDRKEFNNVAAASRFAGYTLPEIRSQGWSMERRIIVTKVVGLNETLVEADMSYRRDRATIHLKVTRPQLLSLSPVGTGTPQPTTIQNTNGTLSSNANFDLYTAVWSRDGMTFMASSFRSLLPESEFLAAIETIR